jgi:hypothetical protein
MILFARKFRIRMLNEHLTPIAGLSTRAVTIPLADAR